ncbi:hypothetical protein [Thermomonas sp.]|uniref:hypothetical protein n=1 Tax=Thermomonas sp. TaxID=1971895 RepID=UPI00391B2256
MTKFKVLTGVLLFVGGLVCPPELSALQYAGDGWWCEPSTSEVVDGKVIVHGGDCYLDPFYYGSGGGGGTPPDPSSGGGGGGGVPEPPPFDPNVAFPDLAISPELKCVLDKYIHPESALTQGRTMKRVEAWAFKQYIDGVPQYGLVVTSSNTPPGPTYLPVGGTAGHLNLYGRLYNAAFRAGRLKKTGIHYTGEKEIDEYLTRDEMSVFVAGHEAAHLMIGNASEEMADWYGIYTLQKYRKDKEQKCR